MCICSPGARRVTWLVCKCTYTHLVSTTCSPRCAQKSAPHTARPRAQAKTHTLCTQPCGVRALVSSILVSGQIGGLGERRFCARWSGQNVCQIACVLQAQTCAPSECAALWMRLLPLGRVERCAGEKMSMCYVRESRTR